MPDIRAQQGRAELFRSLHDDFLVLPNAWDAGSARLITEAGASAIATSSGAQSWSQAVPDGRSLAKADVLANLERIVAATDLPVSADIESAYADSADDLRATIAQVLATGIVGINLEDSGAPDGLLYDTAAAAERVAAARVAAKDAGVDLFINARTDVFLLGIGDEDGRLADVIARGSAYREAGADGLFVPGLLDLDALGTVARGTGLKVNAMWLPGAPSPEQLREAGVSRYSAGTAIAQVAYTSAVDTARAFLAGQDTAMAASIDYFAFNGKFAK
ncbi:isocitrate lyase/phosphoenolpyruvate mutase family protein [Streptosporangium sp. NPDC002544]|uniref:isocitrate lyase/PEP mutase family protein n=1 Tax=Streptosporangium sp. NPDC002544 TaxID=3154538 RepID=UPI00332FC0E9